MEWVWQGAQQAAPLQENTFERSTLIGEIVRTEDGYIIRKCLDGDPAAFGLLVDKYRSSLYALAYSKVGNFHDAQDIAQEAFIKAYRKLHTLKQYDNFLAWLYAITYNLCKNWIRAKSRRPDREFVEDQDPKSIDRTSMHSYQEGLARESIREALDSLPEIYREVLSLYYLGGMSVKEIAKFLGISPNTIVQRLNRGRLKLREETLIMMTATFNQYKLQPAFTFRIVEMVKRIGVLPRAPWLPWGLSLVTGTILTILGFITSPILFNPNVDLSSSEVLIEAKVLEAGEIPVDITKVSDMPIMSNKSEVGAGLKPAPTLRDALAFLFAPQAGEGKWTNKADMPTARAWLSTSAVNGKIYAIGGGTPIEILSKVEEYDPVTNKWTKRADMPTPRGRFSTSVVNGKIYAIGGVNFGFLSIVEEYDPVTNRWTRKADMPTPRERLSTSVVNGKIYVIGGYGAKWEHSTVEEYDPKTDRWTKKTDMPTARQEHSSSAVNEKIYVMGGSTLAVEEYDPATDTWTKKADMPPAIFPGRTRRGLSTSAVNGKIYVIGGWNGSQALSIVEEYDPVTDTWTKKIDIPMARYHLSTSAVGGKIYAIGGIGAEGIFSTVEEFDTGFAGEAEEGQGVEAKGKHATSWGKMKK